MPMPALECDHCGGDAIESGPDGLFTDDTGEACDECGFPGCVHIEEDEDGNNVAAWAVSGDDAARCNLAGCAECTKAAP